MATHLYPKGRCAEGELCKFPSLWLRPQDNCPDCKQITHPLCGVLTKSKNKYRCSSCANKVPNTPSDSATTITQSDSQVERTIETKKKDDIPKDVSCTEIIIKNQEKCGTIVSTITETKDCTNFTSIPKDYFIKSDQTHNTENRDRDGNIWQTLNKAKRRKLTPI